MKKSMDLKLMSHAALLLTMALAPTFARVLMQDDVGDQGGWIEGRATWYDHPWTGSCGYGQLDNYEFGIDAVAAMPDIFKDYNTSCGRCYEVKCRGIQAISADGTVNLPRQDACYDESTSIIVKIVDTCPCVGNEKWCCGDMDHLDLSAQAFSKLAPQGKGIIGLNFRPVPCSAAAKGGAQEVTKAEWDTLSESVALGADPNVFVEGEIGLGWKKTVYGDANQAMYTYNPSIQQFDDDSAAVCADFQQYGGFDFHTQALQIDLFREAQGVEFWVETQAGVPDMAFRLGNIKGGICWKEQMVQDAVAASTSTQAGWTRVYFPLEAFDCKHEVKPENINRVQWEAKSPGGGSICVKDVRVIL